MKWKAAGLILVAAMLVLGQPLAVAADKYNVTLGKARVLRLGLPAAIVMIGDPNIADVSVESPQLMFIIGQSVGETNLVLLDENGAIIHEYDIVVVPEGERHVTVVRAPDGVTTLSCNPKCTGIDNPGEETAKRTASSTKTSSSEATTVPDALGEAVAALQRADEIEAEAAGD